jgi:hypothetical protein
MSFMLGGGDLSADHIVVEMAELCCADQLDRYDIVELCACE